MYPLVTIAVITRNRAASLKRTLESFKSLNYENIEVIVVDNASDDDTASVIQSYNYKYLYSRKGNGFSVTRQLAIDASSGEFILWCDDDCVPNSYWVNAYVSMFKNDPNLALIGGQVINHNFPPSLKFKGTEIIIENGILKPVENPNEAVCFANLNMAIRKSAVIKIGGYDPFFKGGYEEVDLNMSMRKAGFKIAYCKEAYADHFHNQVSFKKGRWYFGGQLMRLYFYYKHKSDLNNKYFYRNEIKMLFVDIYHSIRLMLSGCKRLSLKRVQIGGIELFNSITARITIPVVIVQAKRSRRSLLFRINSKV